jgi:hypothetical protein
MQRESMLPFEAEKMRNSTPRSILSSLTAMFQTIFSLVQPPCKAQFLIRMPFRVQIKLDFK